MDIMDLASKAIVAMTKNFGKKVNKGDPAPEIPDAAPVSINGSCWRAGFSSTDIVPVFPGNGKTYYIAGHGSGHVMDGIISPAYIHAMWLDCGGDEGILWLAADVIGLTRIEVNKIRDMIMASPKIKGCRHINVSCTHSHSGVDTVGYWGKPNLVSIPSNGRDNDYMDMLMRAAVKISEEAYAAKREGKLYTGRIAVPGGLCPKRDFVDRHEVLTRMRFVPDDGSEEIWVMNFGGHPNSLGGSNRKFSGEYPQFMREEIKKSRPVNILFAIGAVGGMDAKIFENTEPLECVKLQGKMLAEKALEMTDSRELEPGIRFINQPFYLPISNNVLTLLATRGVMSFKAYPCKEGSEMGIAIMTEMTYMTFGDQKVLLLPGENFVSTVYGSYNSAETSATGKGPEINPAPLAEICGDPEMISFGVSNDMTGYVVPVNDWVLNPTQPYLNGTRDRFNKNHYHETNSMGPETQKVIADTFTKVVKNF